MVAATFAPNIRRVIPRWFEVTLWVALIFVCWWGIAGIKDPQARELTASINWAAGQIFNTLIGMAGLSVLDMMHANRFAIANAVVTLFGADLLALALLSTHRQGLGWQPTVRLRDWMEIPAVPVPVMLQAPVPDAVEKMNERLAAATITAGAAAATWSAQFLIWARDFGLPRAEERLAPEVNKLALRVAAILNGVSDAEQRVSPSAGNLAQVVDIKALRMIQSLNQSGRTQSVEKKDEINDDPEHPNRLAS